MCLCSSPTSHLSLSLVSLQQLQLQLLHCVHRGAGLRSTRFRCALLSFRLATVPLLQLYLPWRPHAALQSTCLPSANFGFVPRPHPGCTCTCHESWHADCFPDKLQYLIVLMCLGSACKFREIKETTTGTGGSAVIRVLSVLSGKTPRYSNYQWIYRCKINL